MVVVLAAFYARQTFQLSASSAGASDTVHTKEAFRRVIEHPWLLPIVQQHKRSSSPQSVLGA